MRRGRRGERMSVNGEINVVSLIDVMMLLMVIFMITAPIMQGGIDVTLPQANAQPLEAKSGVIVTLTQTGGIYVDDTPLSYAEFASSIKALTERKGGGGVFVKADTRVAHGSVMRILGALTAAGITDIGMIAEPEAAR